MGDQLDGNPVSVERPSRDGPRHSGQSLALVTAMVPARVSAATDAQRRAVVLMSVRLILLLMQALRTPVRLCLLFSGTGAHRELMADSALFPGIQDLNAAVSKVTLVARHERERADTGRGGKERVQRGDRPSGR